MAVFGSGGGNGEELAERRKIIESIETETDVVRLAKLVAFDQVDYDYDPCGKSELVLNNSLTDMSRKALVRLNKLFGFSDVKARST